MTIPAETTVHELTVHGGVAANDVFDGASRNMAIMRRAGGERWPVIEGKLG